MSYKEKPQLHLYEYKNNSFIQTAIIDDYQEVSFERNLYSAGTFTITINYNIPNALLFERGMFIQFGSDPYDFGEILSIRDVIGQDGKGSQIRTITGYDARYIFKRRIIKNLNANGMWKMTAKGEICLRNLIADQCGANAEEKRRLPITNTIPLNENALGKEYSVSEQFTNLYEVCKTIATQSEIGWRVKFDNGSLKLECYEGTDRSDTVQFSTDFDSLRNGEFSDSSESYSNAIYIGGKGQNDERDIYEGEDGTPNGLERFEAWDAQSQMTTTDEYTAEALSMLSQYGQTVNVSGNGLAKCPYVYKEQYNVGDIITISFSGKMAKVQILSVTERWAWNQYDINFSFGKPQNNLAEQLQLMLRKIQGASNKEKATESVKWYTIPTVTSMPADDVTFNTIGFTGTMTANSTFALYRDSEGTGSKSYNVYCKNLSGNYTLTLTTGVSGATNFTIKGGSNIVARILVDENGNIVSQGMTATSVVESGNNQPATSSGVSNAINNLNIQSVGSTSFKARLYSNIVNNTEYEFADIVSISDVTNAIISISTTSLGNVCGSTWLVSIGNSEETCGIILLNKSGYGNGNKTLLKVNYDAVGNCSLVFKLSSLGIFSNNNQSGYISILCLNGQATLKEKTTTQTSRSFTKSLETNQLDGNQIATDTLIDGVITNAKILNPIFNMVNSGGSTTFYKISGMMGISMEAVFLLQSRAGELIVISCGHGDVTTLETPKIKRLLTTYSKIAGFSYSGSDVYMAVNAYSHECILTQIAGNRITSISITSATQAQYNAGTPITIET